MHLQNLSVINFKSHKNGEYSFIDGANCFVGNNGVGKTNLLDAIHYLSFTKSYFNSVDGQNISHDEEFFVTQGNFLKKDENFAVHCGVKRGKKKSFKKNKKEYSRLSQHIGEFPCIMISPADTALITGTSDLRRKFLDTVISQTNPEYLNALIKYNKVLNHRNALLKSFNQYNNFDAESLQIWDDQLIELGSKIHSIRVEFLVSFKTVFQDYYKFISQNNEEIRITYKSQLTDVNFEKLLQQNLNRDRITEHTSVGIHKDDLDFSVNEFPIKKVGSQGQQKSFLIALKLAQFDITKNVSGFKPILLLDDIFDKLDDTRVSQLMQLVSEDNFGQFFISDTHPKRIANIFKDLKIELNLHNLNP